MEEGYNKTKSALKNSIRVGVGAGRTLAQALQEFFRAYHETKIVNGVYDAKSVEKAMKGHKFTNEAHFVLNAKKDGMHGFSNVAVSKAELKKFEKLCKEYGVDFHYQKRPEGLDEAFAKIEVGEPVSAYEEKMIKAFTVENAEGTKTLIPDGGFITFNERDLQKVEMISMRMQKDAINIQKRKATAQEKKEAKQAQKEKSHEKNQSKNKEATL